MTQENIIAMAREAWGLEFIPDYDVPKLERFAALVRADEREKLVVWMMAQGYTDEIERDWVAEWMGYTPSHGDAMEGLLEALTWAIKRRVIGLVSDMSSQVIDRVEAEREACAKLCDAFESDADPDAGAVLAKAIRARGQI